MNLLRSVLYEIHSLILLKKSSGLSVHVYGNRLESQRKSEATPRFHFLRKASAPTLRARSPGAFYDPILRPNTPEKSPLARSTAALLSSHNSTSNPAAQDSPQDQTAASGRSIRPQHQAAQTQKEEARGPCPFCFLLLFSIALCTEHEPLAPPHKPTSRKPT